MTTWGTLPSPWLLSRTSPSRTATQGGPRPPWLLRGPQPPPGLLRGTPYLLRETPNLPHGYWQ